MALLSQTLPGEDVLSVLPLFFLALVCGAVRSACRERGSMAARLQMVKQLVSRGELVVAGDAAEDYFLLQAKSH